MAAKVKVDFVGDMSDLDDSLDDFDRKMDRLEKDLGLGDGGGGGGGGGLGGAAMFGAVAGTAMQLVESALTAFANMVSGAVSRNEVISKATGELGTAFEGLLDQVVKAAEAFAPLIDSVADLVSWIDEKLKDIEDKGREFGEENPGMADFSWWSLLIPGGTMREGASYYERNERMKAEQAETNRRVEQIKPVPRDDFGFLMDATEQPEIGGNRNFPLFNVTDEEVREHPVLPSWDEMTRGAEKVDFELDTTELDAEIADLRAQKKELLSQEAPEEFSAQWEEAGQMFKRMQAGAASTDNDEWKADQKRAADALDVMLDKGIKLREELNAKFN